MFFYTNYPTPSNYAEYTIIQMKRCGYTNKTAVIFGGKEDNFFKECSEQGLSLASFHCASSTNSLAVNTISYLINPLAIAVAEGIINTTTATIFQCTNAG